MTYMYVQFPSYKGTSNLLTCLSFDKLKEGAKSQCNPGKKKERNLAIKMAATFLDIYEISLNMYIFRLSGSVLVDSNSSCTFHSKPFLKL